MASVAVHRVAVLHLPAGLVLAAVATVLAALALAPGRPHLLPTAYAAGWVIVFGVALLGRPEGDFAVTGDPRGYGLMGVAFVLVVIGVEALVGRGSGVVRPGT